MALTTSEVQRIKAELKYHLLTVSAEPMIGYYATFEQVIQPYLQAGASTTVTLTTAIAAATTPTPQTLPLASATGFSAFDRVVIDVDDRQEVATIQLLDGTDMTVLLSKAHSGTFPVMVEGGEAFIRQILHRLDSIAVELGEGATGAAGVKRVDEITFHDSRGGSRLASLEDVQAHWRDKLAAALGVENLWNQHQASGASVALW